MISGPFIYLVNINCRIMCDFFFSQNLFFFPKDNLNCSRIMVLLAIFSCFIFFFSVLLQTEFRKCKSLPRSCSRIWVYLLIGTLTANPELTRHVSQSSRRNIVSKLFIPLPLCSRCSPHTTPRKPSLFQRGTTVQRIVSHMQHTDA